MIDLKQVKHIHFVGIAGSGMSVLAEAFHANGYDISGSDMKDSSRVSQLRELGISISVPHSIHHIKTAQLVCFSSAIPESNCERSYARENAIPQLCRGELLSVFLNQKEIFAVAGSHGKTTTSAYLANVLNKLGHKSGLFIGGVMQNEAVGDWLNDRFVVETDESDGTFLHFKPRYGIITNIDREHLGFYGDFENLVKAFEKFFMAIENFPVICGDDKLLDQMAYESKRSCIRYGLGAHNDIWANHIEHENNGTSFDVVFKSAYLGRIYIPLLGKHNVSNAMAIIALATVLGYEFTEIKSAIKTFSGVKRRMELKASVGTVSFVDDYAHHPTEIKATLSAAQQFCEANNRRLVVIFEPHRHSRVRECYHEFVTCFDGPDLIIVTDIYGAAEARVESVDIQKFYADIKLATDTQVLYIASEKLQESVAELLEEDDYVLGMGAGNITKFLEDIAFMYREKNGKY